MKRQRSFSEPGRPREGDGPPPPGARGRLPRGLLSRALVGVRLLGLGLVLTAAAAAAGWSYPAAPVSAEGEFFGEERVADPYRWLEQTGSVDTLEWLRAQGRLTEGLLSALPLRETLRERMARLWSLERFSLPQRGGGSYYFLHSDGTGRPPAIEVVDTPESPPRALVDAGRLVSPEGATPNSVVPSPDGRRLLYSRAAAGSDWNEYRILNLDTMAEEPDLVGGVKFSTVGWTADGAGFFYSRYPQAPSVAGADSVFGAVEDHRLYYHRVGTPQRRDVLIHAWKGEGRCFVRGRTSQDGRYLVVALTRGTAPETRILCADLGDPLSPDIGAPLRPLVERWDSQFDFVGNVGQTLFFRTTWGAPRGCIMTVDFDGARFGAWRTVVPEGPDTIEGASLLGGRLVVRLLRDVCSRVRFYTPDGLPAGQLELPANGNVTGLAGAWEDSRMMVGYTDFFTPPCNLVYDFSTGELKALHGRAPGADTGQGYVTEQHFFTSSDGARIPMFVTRRSDVPLDGNAPAWLYGYGGFNLSLKPSFSVPVMTWLEQGGIYAVPNLRGGGEYGREWHEAGLRERRPQVIADFVAAAEHLVASGYTSPRRLFVSGESNGGMLVAAAVNLRPELFRVAAPTSGVMDMLRYHRFTIGYAWSNEYGSSDDPSAFRYLRAYSPLHNIRAGLPYPAMLVISGDNDDRVHPSHSYKYVAALQAAVSNRPGDLPVLLRVAPNSGHGSGRSLSRIIAEDADRLAFALHYIRIVP